MKKYNKYIILSPHSDDAAFSLGCTIINNIIGNIHILNIFSQSTCTVNDVSKDLSQVTEIRKNEDELFFSLSKSKVKLIYLDLFDAPIRLNINEEDVCSVYNNFKDNCLKNEVNENILSFLTEDSLLLSPLGLGNHVDHLFTREIAIKLLKNNNDVGFYEDLPYAGSISQLEVELFIDKLNSKKNINLTPFVINTHMTIDDKINACAVYSSQIDGYTLKNIKKHHNQFDDSLVFERIWITKQKASI